jgi:hypothetical protein
MLQREGQPAAHQGKPRLDLPELGADGPLETETPCQKVDARCPRCLLGRGQDERKRIVEPAGSVEVGGQRQALGGSLTRETHGGKRLDGSLPRGKRPVPLALQCKGAGQPALRFSTRS